MQLSPKFKIPEHGSGIAESDMSVGTFHETLHVKLYKYQLDVFYFYFYNSHTISMSDV